MKTIKLVLLLAVFFLNSCSSQNKLDYTDFVDPFIGTGGHGHTYPGATLPFGMVQLSPDTRTNNWDACSGYHFSDDTILGFSHTHLSGTGIGDYGDVRLMPTVGMLKIKPGEKTDPDTGYRSRFKHEKEKAHPGYYSVLLDDYKIQVELTSTLRAGFHKYIFPESDSANIIIDLTNGITPDKIIDLKIDFISDSEIRGLRRTSGWAKDQYIYFVAEFSKPFESFGVVIDDQINQGIRRAQGKDVKAFVKYSTRYKEVIYVKVGISAVSSEGARINLSSEIPDWNFNRVRQNAKKIWNKALSKIEVIGGSTQQKRIFYTSFYHTLLNPNLFMDVDRKYRGIDHNIHIAESFDNYTVFSLWDTFRATHPLFTIIEQERTVDFVKTLLAKYDEGGILPIWELAGNYTGCMIGYHAVPVIVDAYMKGVRGFDVNSAYIAVKHSAEQDHRGLKYYKKFGYIPADKESESVSKTLEYAYDDWCIAQMARKLGKKDDYKRYIQRAQYYKNLFDPKSGFMRPKRNGSWASRFDPKEVNFNYTEANSWQYSFFVPQDIYGLITLLGGKEKFIRKLDELFNASTETTGRRQADITGLIGQYAHGNEPSHHMAYMYNFAGVPWKTQEKVSEITKRMYSDKPDGLCGNEDCGQMSAWYIFSAMGLYPFCPGDNYYIIGSPIFEKVSIHTGQDKQFVIKANNVSDKNIYIQNATLNSNQYHKTYIKHSDIMNGSELVLTMGPDKNRIWGAHEENIPYSHINNSIIVTTPLISSKGKTFVNSTEISMYCNTEDVKIYYTLDGSEPTIESILYSGPIILNRSSTVKAFALKTEKNKSPTVTATFLKIPSGRSIKLISKPSPQYPGEGHHTLIDFIRGGKNFRVGSWLGYHGNDVDVIVDLKKIKVLKKISAGFLQEINSWIFFPLCIKFLTSTDGKTFFEVGMVKNNTSFKKNGVTIKDFFIEPKDIKARYVRIVAKNIGICPEWHVGAGNKAWIFIDEVIIE